jgi:hypothetical protein
VAQVRLEQVSKRFSAEPAVDKVSFTVEARPVTVGLQVLSSTDQGIEWSVICAATLMTAAPPPVRAELHARRDKVT